ncbi:Tn3 family transposase [Lactococcus lactis]|uniref:Tn3 family transposase n=1 Tax=Lactococcus lactis TaxID=1358 RepID=UPI001913F1AE|nr:Tn3 family transposase [Lactococcus lactis]MBK5077729.1 Tn3 family transposase [Lactococcus lactis]WDA67361.1 Tn3 family transposase [Lactococcus lactis]
MTSYKLISKAQQEALLSLDKLSNDEFEGYFSFSKSDMNFILSHRGAENRLGIGIQLCLARYPGVSFSSLHKVSNSLISYVASQLKITNFTLDNYFRKKNTPLVHLKEICTQYNYSHYSPKIADDIESILNTAIQESNDGLFLINLVIYQLRGKQILLPGFSEIERLIFEIQSTHEKFLYKKISDCLSENQKKQLDSLLVLPKEGNKTPLAWLKDISGKPTRNTIISICQRIALIKEFKLDQLDFSFTNDKRINQIAQLTERYRAFHLQRFEETKRYALLVAYLIRYRQALVDLAIDVHNKIIQSIKRNGIHKKNEENRKIGEQASIMLKHFSQVISLIEESAHNNDFENLFVQLQQSFDWNALIEEGQQAALIAFPRKKNYMDLVQYKAQYLRGYLPLLVETLEFKLPGKKDDGLINALNLINELKKDNKRKIPSDTTLDFVKRPWKTLVKSPDGTINRAYFELIAATELNDRLRSGEVIEPQSVLHQEIDHYLVDSNITKGSHTIPDTFEDYISFRTEVLDERLKTYQKLGKSFDKLTITKKEKSTPAEAERYKEILYQLLPSVDLVDLLIEVNSWTGFMNEFLHDATKNPPNTDELEVLFATLLAMGLNIRFQDMEKSTHITSAQMSNAKQWRMSASSFKRAQAVLINKQIVCPFSKYWGDGSKASSDGLRIQLGVSSIHSDFNPHYGNEKGTTIYRHTADKYISHYVEVIATNQREAASAIDGVIGHNTELNIEEHFTDTNAYTDTAFAIFHLLGFKFEPRIRDIGSMQLYTIKSPKNYPKIQPLIKRSVNLGLIEKYYNEIKQIAYSIQTRKTSAKIILSKLGSYARKNKVAQALGELGKIEKTIFLLDYAINEDLRKVITQILNRGELINDLSRELFNGQRGKFMEKDVKKQLQSASALNILINAISLWNAVYLQKAYDYCKESEPELSKYLEYTSPIIWRHINLLGEYTIDLDTLPKNLRDLNQN